MEAGVIDGYLFDRDKCMPLPEDSPLQQRFERYHAANPHVYEDFCMWVEVAMAMGHKRLGARFIMGRMRWEQRARHHVDPEEEYLLNNDYSSRYARMWQCDHPDKADFFETRRLRA